MKTNLLSDVAVMVVVALTPTLHGCSDQVVAPPAEVNSETVGEAGGAVPELAGQVLFEEVLNRCLTCIPLHEAVLLTPYLVEEREMSLSDAVELTPVIRMFQDHFNAEMAQLSVGELLEVVDYMKRTGKDHYPYPDLGNYADDTA